MSDGPLGLIGGLAMIPPLGVEEERRLHPVIQRGREAAAALGRAEVFGLAGFFDGADVRARRAGLLDLGALRRCAGCFSAMAPAINAPI